MADQTNPSLWNFIIKEGIWKVILFVLLIIIILTMLFVFLGLLIDSDKRIYYFRYENNSEINEIKCLNICEDWYPIMEDYKDRFKCICYKNKEEFTNAYLKQKEEFYKRFPQSNVTEVYTKKQ